MKRWGECILAYLMVGVLGSPSVAGQDQVVGANAEALRVAALEYCQNDLVGNAPRDSFILTSGDERVSARGRGEDVSWPHVDLTWDPLLVATSYRVGQARQSGEDGVVLVTFREVAASRLGARYRGVGPRDVQVTLHLRHHGRRWWVVQPPLPRVSPEKILHALAVQMSACDSSWYEGASVEQLRTARARIDAMSFLKAMLAEHRDWN